MKKLLLLSLLLAGCATVELTEAGKRVRQVKTSPTGCKFLGTVHGAGRDFDSLTHDTKNKAAALGGDTIEVTARGEDETDAETYRCEK